METITEDTVETCQCSPGVRLCGDGCRYCQPQKAIDILEAQEESWSYDWNSMETRIQNLGADKDELITALKRLLSVESLISGNSEKLEAVKNARRIIKENE